RTLRNAAPPGKSRRRATRAATARCSRRISARPTRAAISTICWRAKRFPSRKFIEPQGRGRLSDLGKILQYLDRHGDDVGHSPCGRDSDFAGGEDETLREYIVDDRDDPALAVDHRCSRRAVIDDKPVVAFVHLEERRAGKLAVIAVLPETAAHETRPAIRIGQRRDLLVRSERRRTDRNAPGGGDRVLQLDH